MKGILEFNLPEESHEFRVAQYGQATLSALGLIQEHIRRKLKYGDPAFEGPHGEAVRSAWEDFRTIVYDAMQAYDVTEDLL